MDVISVEVYRCFYCGKEYSQPKEALMCQLNHEKVIKKNNTESINHYILNAMLNKGDISDGQKTFKELYQEKNNLTLALLVVLSKMKKKEIWYSDFFSDGSRREGFFLVGLNYEPEYQITFLLPYEMKGYVRQVGMPLSTAPPYQAHSTEEVTKRLYEQIILNEEE